MRARVVKAWVNMVPKWRVYYNQEPIALFEQKDWAQKYADYLNANY